MSIICGDVKSKPTQIIQSIQDSIQPDQFVIVYDNGTKKKATAEECSGLERLAVWTAESIQERLIDHYAGRKNFRVSTENTKSYMDKDNAKNKRFAVGG